jgi:hypothetical protein
MKAILRKDKDHYRLFVEDKQIGSTGTRVPSKEMYLLSFENCDSLFGVVDVEKLADEAFPDESEPGWRDSFSPRERKGFKSGFNKAMELMKDKVFTAKDMENAFLKGVSLQIDFPTFQQSLQQPNEIEVEIETTMRPVWGDESSMRATYVKKLDSEGCLILKKI